MNVYRHTTYPPSWRQLLMAAVLAGGPGTVVSHRAAARLHGLDGAFGELVEVTVDRCHNYRSHPGVTVHRGDPVGALDVERVEHIPVTTVTRTLIDLGTKVDIETLELALESGLRCRRTSLRLLRQRLDALGSRGRPGVAAIRRVLALRGEAPATGSAMETRYVQLLRRAELPEGIRQYVVSEGGRFVAKADFAHPEEHVLVELDGWQTHGTPGALRDDLDRQNAILLALPGWTLLRYTWDEIVHHPEQVIAQQRQALGLAEALDPAV